MATSCRLLPHGAYSLLPATLTTLGWIASLFHDACNYAKVTGNVVDDMSNTPDLPFVQVGFQAYREASYNVETNEWDIVKSGVCIEYPSDVVEMDWYWNFSKAFSFLALVLGGGATFFLWIPTCLRFNRGSWRWAGYEVALACIFQALSFLWFATDLCMNNNCELLYGAKADIIATVFWFVAALLIFCHYPSRGELGQVDAVMSPGETAQRNGDKVQQEQVGMASGQDSGQDGRKDLEEVQFA